MRKLILLLCFAMLPIAGVYSPEAPIEQNKKYEFAIKKRLFFDTIYDRHFSPELLREAIIFCGIKHPKIAFRQAVLETAGFTSDIFRQANNVFGMKMAQTRITTAISTYKYHAKYRHWVDSVIDYKIWQDWYERSGYIMDDYYTFLRDLPYATDKNYIKKLKSIS